MYRRFCPLFQPDEPGRTITPEAAVSAGVRTRQLSGPRVVSLLLIGMTGGCSFIIPSTNHIATSERHCAPASPMSFAQAEEDKHDTASSHDSVIPLSPRAIEAANVMEVMPILSRMAELQAAGDTGSVAYLELRQSLTDRLLLTLFEVSSTVAEIVCERDRADQVADRMEEIDATLVRTLTLVSIVVSGVAAVVSGGIGLAGGASTASDASGVAGGVIASVFGGTALFATSKQEFHHERNLLKEVWDNPGRSAAFSPAVWRFLQRQHKDPTGTARDEVVKAWQQQGRLGEQGSDVEQQRIRLFFGPGGTYSATDLRARASMLETLEAHIQLLSEELELFLRELIQSRIRRTPQEGPPLS